MKLSCPGLLFDGCFQILVSISLLVNGLFIFYMGHSWYLSLSKNLSISSMLSILLANCCLQCLMILYISVVSIITSPFSFLIVLTYGLCPLFLMSLAKGLSILFNFSKNQLLVSLIFSALFIVSIFFSDFYDFFSSANFWFYYSFSTFLRRVVRLFEICLFS